MALLLPLLVSGGCAARARQRADESARAVRAVESQRVRAMIASDVPTLDGLLSDDLTYTHADGRVQRKVELLAALHSGAMKYLGMEHEDVRVVAYGDAVVLTGRSRLTVQSGDGREMIFPVRFTLVYVNEGGQWRMVAWQSTRD